MANDNDIVVRSDRNGGKVHLSADRVYDLTEDKTQDIINGELRDIAGTGQLSGFPSGVDDLTEAANSLKETLDTKVSKSGDTMTGALQCKVAYTSNGSYPTNQWAQEIYFKDSDNVNIGQVRTGHYANGNEVVEIFARRKVSGTDVFNTLALGVKPDGSKYIESIETYAANDTFSIASTSTIISGLTNNGATTLYLELITDKSMANISSISLTAMAGYIVGINGRINGNSNDYTGSGYSVVLLKQSDRHIRIAISNNPSSAFSNATGDTPICYFGTLTLQFS